MDEAQLSGGIDRQPDQTVALGQDHCGTAALLHIFAHEGSVVALVGDQFARCRNSADALHQAGDIGYVSGRYNERSGPTSVLGLPCSAPRAQSLFGHPCWVRPIPLAKALPFCASGGAAGLDQDGVGKQSGGHFTRDPFDSNDKKSYD